MKKTIYTLAAILCVLTILVGATCTLTGTHQNQSCNHCTKHSPLQQPTTSCCTVHHLPSSPTASTSLEQPAAAMLITSSLFPPVTLAVVQPLDVRTASLPPLHTLIALRI
ncbi:hypothetical protein [Edaphobacter bradus]|uniref:hypothetical protein n=1 Tax=Edaphobacter bradus TaxID=2259016 RepID=UPI0021E0D6C0|nr:hypothetical protein [Edaphobacter bradus]